MAGLLGLNPGGASALEIDVHGSVVSLSGPIKNGDEFAFRDLLAKFPDGTFRIVQLNSSGGKIQPADAIGQIIRARKMTTFVDARTSNCASACTILFASGTHRHYVNAGSIRDAEGPKPGFGLGYHQGNDPLSLDANHLSGAATGGLISAYYEFGVPAAADLALKAGPNRMYRVSGQTALSLGLATSLSPP